MKLSDLPNGKELKVLAQKAYPDYPGRKFYADTSGEVEFYDTNWSGGTCNKYIGVKLDDLKTQQFNAPAPWNNPVEGKKAIIPEGYAVIKRSFFCGRDGGITIYMNKVLTHEVKKLA